MVNMIKPSTLAMILAGSRVDKLNVLTYYRPKSAVPFGGFARVIDFPLSNLLHSGIEVVQRLLLSLNLPVLAGNRLRWFYHGLYVLLWKITVFS